MKKSKFKKLKKELKELKEKFEKIEKSKSVSLTKFDPDCHFYSGEEVRLGAGMYRDDDGVEIKETGNGSLKKKYDD